ncbi:MAG TPA: hypothetical protein VH573_07980 [Mycobacteriales bacterium]
MSGLRLAGSTETADLASFLGRLVALDPAAVVRLRSAAARITAYARLPFGVLVSRTVAGDADPGDVTVGAGDLLTALDRVSGPDAMAWPARREMDWRAALPPADGWVRLDAVPGDVVLKLVRAGREALRAVPAGAATAAGESLLDHESLTVTGAGRTAVLPLRVLGSLTRMGFLGDGGEPVVVSVAAGWTRLAGAYGSAYQHTAPGLTLGPR